MLSEACEALRRKGERLGLDLGDVMAERSRRPPPALETVLLACWTRPSAASPVEAKRDRRERKKRMRSWLPDAGRVAMRGGGARQPGARATTRFWRRSGRCSRSAGWCRPRLGFGGGREGRASGRGCGDGRGVEAKDGRGRGGVEGERAGRLGRVSAGARAADPGPGNRNAWAAGWRSGKGCTERSTCVSGRAIRGRSRSCWSACRGFHSGCRCWPKGVGSRRSAPNRPVSRRLSSRFRRAIREPRGTGSRRSRRSRTTPRRWSGSGYRSRHGWSVRRGWDALVRRLSQGAAAGRGLGGMRVLAAGGRPGGSDRRNDRRVRVRRYGAGGVRAVSRGPGVVAGGAPCPAVGQRRSRVSFARQQDASVFVHDGRRLSLRDDPRAARARQVGADELPDAGPRAAGRKAPARCHDRHRSELGGADLDDPGGASGEPTERGRLVQAAHDAGLRDQPVRYASRVPRAPCRRVGRFWRISWA